MSLVAAWFSLKRLPGLVRSIASASWPLTHGSFETVNVITFAEQALGQFGYSYSVNGERYAGYVSRQFADEQDAWDFLRSMEGQSVFVRYKATDPATSAIRIDDQSALLAPKQPSVLGPLLFRSVLSSIGLRDWEGPPRLWGANWDLTKGRIEGGSVQRRKSRNLFPLFEGEVSYSYNVSGQYHWGHFSKLFVWESRAHRFTESLIGKDVLVRYQVESPQVSRLRPEDQLDAELS